LLPCLAIACAVSAAPVAAGGYADTVSGASIEWEDVEFGVDYGGTPATLEMTRVGATLIESYHRYLSLGLRGGYVQVTSVDDPDLAGLDPHGGFLGINGALALWQGSRLSLIVQADYAYVYASTGDPATQKAALRWTEGGARLMAGFRIGPFQLVAGSYTLEIDGEKVLSGATSLTDGFEAAKGSGSFGGVDFLVETDGRVGVRVERGAREGLAFVFARDF
jgi:hypothetical protein